MVWKSQSWSPCRQRQRNICHSQGAMTGDYTVPSPSVRRKGRGQASLVAAGPRLVQSNSVEVSDVPPIPHGMSPGPGWIGTAATTTPRTALVIRRRSEREPLPRTRWLQKAVISRARISFDFYIRWFLLRLIGFAEEIIQGARQEHRLTSCPRPQCLSSRRSPQSRALLIAATRGLTSSSAWTPSLP